MSAPNFSNFNYSGTFEVQECEILTHSNIRVPIDSALVEVNIHEDITGGFISGNISFLDTTDAVLNHGIVGNEYVYMKIVTPSDEDVSLDFTRDPLVITSVNQTSQGQGRLVHLTLSSREFVKNFRTRISQSFSGTITDMVARILRDEQFLGTKKTVELGRSYGLEKIVIPNLRPITALQMLTQRAKNRNDSPFLFFETLKGLNFLSFESLARQDTKTNFTLGVSDTYDDRPSKSTQIGLNVIRQLGQVEGDELISNSVLTNTINGMYSSRMLLHDIYNKTYHDIKFKYTDQFSKRNDLETSIGEYGFPTFPIGSSVDESGKTVEEFNDSHLNVQSTSGYKTPKGSVHNINPYPRTIYPFEESSVSEHLLSRRHKLSFIDQMGMKIQMVGNLSIQASDIIRINVFKSKTDVDNPEEDLYDERLTGRYLITSLVHSFKFGEPKKHTIVASVMKDSVTKPYANNLPPNPKRLI